MEYSLQFMGLKAEKDYSHTYLLQEERSITLWATLFQICDSSEDFFKITCYLGGKPFSQIQVTKMYYGTEMSICSDLVGIKITKKEIKGSVNSLVSHCSGAWRSTSWGELGRLATNQ